MLPKITALIVTTAILIATSAIILLLMLVALNGYSENDAMWGLGTYVVLAVILTAAMAAGAGVTTRALIGKQMSALVSSLIAISLFSIGGVIAGIVCSLIGVGVAEFVRVMF